MTRVLVVDDEPRVARAIEFALSNSDVELVSLTDPAQVESVAAAQRPDAILLDIGLKTADGLELCRRLKADQRFRDIPVLLLSGQTDPGTKATGLAAGADDFVGKPFVPTELLARINAQIRKRNG
ncbi:MAG: response regulator [Chloroflexota bacterium]|nr:response regulator [Chloroflexota bacterium]